MVEKSFQAFLPEENLLLRTLMWKRGWRDPAAAYSWLYPSFDDLPQSYDKLKDIEAALGLVLQAKDRSDKILIYGDYDVDGSTASSVMYRSLKTLGFQVEFFIPRRVEEGYGISLEGAKRILDLHPETRLVISVDCGVSSFEGIDYLKSKSVSVIVTDHHSPPSERVKADALINPKQNDCEFEAKNLAGVGVAFFFILALRKALQAKDFRVRPLLSFVALGSLCDMVPMDQTNRTLIRYGLEEIEKNHYLGLKALLQVSGIQNRPIRSEDCGFALGPRINAVGRVGNPRLATELLVSENWAESLRMASELDQLNQQRKEMQAEQVQLAMQRVQNETGRTIVVEDPSFHIGIVGLVASTLVREKKKLACVLAPVEDEHSLADFSDTSERIWKASLRGLKGFNLVQILQEIQAEHPEVLLNAGGHAMAAGLSLKESQLKTFKKLFEASVEGLKVTEVEEVAELELRASEDLEEFVEKLEPFGPGWQKPKLLIRDFDVGDYRLLKERHLKLFGQWAGKNWSLLQFNSPWASLWESQLASKACRLDFVGELSENHWGGKKSLEFLLFEPLRLREGKKEYGFVSGKLSERTNEVGQSASP